MFLRIFVFLQITYISLIAGTTPNTTSTDAISKLNNQLSSASDLLKEPATSADGKTVGTLFSLASYFIIFIGLVFMAIGINETFIAQDRGHENKKMHGVLKIIGGACFIAIMAFYNAVKAS